MPSGLGQGVRIELARAFHPPFETPIVVAVNGALMCGLWFLLPSDIKDLLFTLHGPLAFGLVLAAWMYSDVPATNVFGPDPRRAMAALDDPVMLRRLLYAKSIVLWLLITPLCAVIALAVGLNAKDYPATALAIAWIVVVPFGTLGVSQIVGIVYPYHPIPIKERWAHHRPWWRKVGRWLALVLTPYGLVPVLAFVIMAPTLLLWWLFSAHGLTAKLPDKDYAWGVLLACVLAAGATYGGHRYGAVLARRRQGKLRTYPADPARG
jgi:hypothetical protein